MTRAQALQKIALLEGLAEGTSSEHEAAAAMRKAVNLREELGIPVDERVEREDERTGVNSASMDNMFEVFADIFEGAGV